MTNTSNSLNNTASPRYTDNETHPYGQLATDGHLRGSGGPVGAKDQLNRRSRARVGPMGKSVAVIGAGPGGLVAARWLLSQGFEPTIFEQGPMLGGQWTGQDGRSGVWPTMHTNSSRTMTRRRGPLRY